MATAIDSSTPSYDYSMIGSMGGEAAQSVNGDMINKIRAAEERSLIAPITDDIDNIALETEKLEEIKAKITEFQDIASYFDIYNDENVFNQYNFDTTGSSVVFEKDDNAVLEDGMTSVNISELAQKDVYQSDTTTAKTNTIGGVDEEDTITIGIAGKPIYQSNKVYIDSTDTIGADDSTSFAINGKTIDTDSNTTWDDLKGLINDAGGNFSASFENNRLVLKSKDEETALTFTDDDDVLSDLGLSDSESGKKFAAVRTERCYTGADDTGDGTGLVGEGEFTLKTDGKSSISFDTTATTTWKELREMIDQHPSYSASFDGDNKLKIMASDSSLSITVSENLENVDDAGFTETKNLTSRTYEEMAAAISKDDDLEATMEKVGDDSYRLILKSAKSGEDNLLTISARGSMDVDDDGNLDAEDALGFGNTTDNHVLTAQNLNATVDGISYDLASNKIELESGISITALKEDETDEVSTLTVSKDTSAVTLAAEAIVAHYNILQETLNNEIYSEDSVIEDKSMLRDILSDVKNILFASYGASEPEYGSEIDEYGDVVLAHSNVTNNTTSLFSFGFSLEKGGNLALDKDIFNDIVNGDDENYNFTDLKNVFTGSYSNKGVGVQIKEYLDALDGYQGTFYNYDLDMIDKKADLEKDKKDELERLDAKYGIMAEQFSSYSGVIAQMEAQFNGIKMMIEMETSGN